MRRSFILICLATLLSFCLKAQTLTTPEITYTGLAGKYAPGFPANVNVWVASNDYIDSYCKVGFSIKKDGRVIGNVADFGSVSYRVRLRQDAYSDWTSITTGSGYIMQEVPLDDAGTNRVVVESFTLGIFEHECVDRGRPIEFKATFDEIGTYTIEVEIYEVDPVANYYFEVATFNCLGSDVLHHDAVALTSTNPRKIATETIVVDVVPSYAINFEGLSANNSEVTYFPPAQLNSVMQGDDYVFQINPTGCQVAVASVTVDGAALVADGSGRYTIANVQSDKNIKVEFTGTYNISTAAVTNGRIVAPATVNCGADAVITFEPDGDYQLETVTLDGNAVAFSNNSYTISNVQANHTVGATFSRRTMPTIAFGHVEDKYAPGFPANVEATIDSHGYLDQLCMVEYEVTRNGQPITNIENYGTVRLSVRLFGENLYTKDLVDGSGIVGDTVTFNGHLYQINAFTASIFDNSTCLNRWRPINFLATFSEIGEYEVTVNLYKAVVDNDMQISELGTSYPNTCTGETGVDKVAFNARKDGQPIASLSQIVNVVPSYEINFVGLGDNTVTAVGRTSENNYLVMQGDDYVFSINPGACVGTISSVKVDGAELPFAGGNYTIANVRENKTVNVVFETSTYTISNGGDSHISVPASVNCGENAEVTITPAADYAIETVTDNGVDVTASLVNNTYTIENVQANHTIAATYTRHEDPTISFEDIADKYAPGFPADAIARINSHGDYDRLCMVEYEISRNGEPIANINNYGTVQFSVRLAGTNTVTRDLTAGSGVVGDTITYNGHLYEINAFSVSIFDNNTCLNRTRPINFHATFDELGTYTVTVYLYNAVVDNPEYQVTNINAYEDCNHVAHNDMIAFNARKGSLITSLSQTINVVPSYTVNFVGLGAENVVTAEGHTNENNYLVMEGDDYVFSISRMDCQSGITSVIVDGNTLYPEGEKYTIANVREDKTVNVTFASQVYVVTAAVEGDNGTISPEMNSIDCGESAVITITPNRNYAIATLTDNSVDVTNSIVNNTYTINNVTTNHNVVVTFAELTHPTISFDEVADKYAPGFPADVIARVNSHAVSGSTDVLDQLCMVEYTITRNGQLVEDIAEFGSVSYTVRLEGTTMITKDLASGHGYISESVDYQPEGGEETTYRLNAFTVSIFDNSDCLSHHRPINFLARFNEVGTYEVNVKLWAATADPMYVTAIHTVDDCDGNSHEEKIAFNAEPVQNGLLDELTQTINVVPSYAITFNGLVEGNTVDLVNVNEDRVRLDSIMEGEDYKFRINLVAGCQDEVSRVTVNGNVIVPNGDVYTIADVREDKTVDVLFSTHTYLVNVSAGANGIAEADAAFYNCGDNAVVTITPNNNYEIATVIDTINGVATTVTDLVEGGIYTITNIAANHSIAVTFEQLTHPTITFENVEDKYAPGFPADVIARVNSHGDFDRLCKVGYTVKRNGEVIRNISEFGTVSLSVRLAQGYNDFTMDLTEGQGFVEQEVEYQPEGSTQNQTFHINAFSIGIFDNYPCLQRDRPVSFHATFNQPGTYEVVVKLYEATEGAQTVVETVNHVDNVCGLGRTYYDRIAVNAETGSMIDSLTQVVNVVPSYAITFNGLVEGNTVDLVNVNEDRVRLDSIMEGEDYKFRINLIDGCQDEVSRVTVNGELIVPTNGVYTIADVREDKNINVAFSSHTYLVTVSAGEHGIAELDAPVYTCGDNAQITITPDQFYSIASVMDGITDVTAEVNNNVYTINNISEDHNITVTFVADALPSLVFEPLPSDKYAPNFPVEATARIYSNGNYDRMCKVEYIIKRNGRVVQNVADFGSLSYSVRLAGNNPVSKEITAGSGFVSETVEYTPEDGSATQTHTLDAFSVGIFDNDACLNRNRPINFVASFTEIGYYEVTVNLYDAICNPIEVNAYEDCNHVAHNDMIAMNSVTGQLLATETISVEVVPSFKITFVGLEDGNEVVADAPAHADSVMYGDNYVFAINGTVGCQTGVESVEVDGNTLTAENGKYTIADVRENKTVNVTFALESFAITASTDGNGNAVVENANVTCGDTAIVTFTPNDGYELASVTDNSQPVSVENNTYIIYGVAEAHEVVATFTQIITPSITFEDIAPKYAPGFPADVTAHINSNGNYDRICKVGYTITRNGEAVERIADFGSVSYSVRLAGTTPVSKDLVNGSGFVSEVVNYENNPIEIDAFSVGIFDSNECLNRNRPLNFHATFTEVGEYVVTINIYEAIYRDGQLDTVNIYEDCNHVSHADMIAFNTMAGNILTTETITITVVPSYVITFNGLEEGNTYTSYEPASGDSIMQGDNFIFSLEGLVGCQTGIESVATDVAVLTADADGKYTIENVQSDMTVTVNYSHQSFAITASATNGTATVDNAEVICGGTAIVTFEANDGYELASVTDNDQQVAVTGNTYTIENVTADHNVVVTFTEIINPSIAFDTIAPKYAPGFPADVIARLNSNGNPDRMIKVGYEVTRNGQPVERISDYGTLSYTVRLVGENTVSRDVEYGNGFISERVDNDGATYYLDAFTVGIFDNNTCVNRNRPIELHAEFDSIGEYNVTIKLYDVDTTHALVTSVGTFNDCNGISHEDKIAISARATDVLATLTQTINVVPSYAITFEGLAEGNTYETFAPANGDSIMQGDNFIFSLGGTAECQTGIESVATADGAPLTADADGKYTIENVQSDMTVVVTYSYESYAINVTTDGNGEAVATPNPVTCGEDAVITITPNANYVLASVIDGDTDVTASVVDGTLTIENVTAEHNVTVTFRNNALPTITVDEYAERYAPGYPADIVGHVNSNENFDRMCKFEYTITRNG
ncbi:MAG: hypothetical protein J5709_01135, partial [Bacteroidales bacterium]|nr:hypothetical protein [Bacteroidales bacterium]